ncbi:polysaccharide deacetylase family protein [Clostridium oryzae]|uniref:Peptidoglycan-N-acetylglucosamine deacetylase n=1 Tax=Clostridium oryzae TaxID=1450648 RepID=A0A1V4IQN5_9CLOT|nr:polysaccharide deacetylase family protein [Clostridium oryzae]OPJ62236.1 peptidoglycan-N-acetylglucosamine deacetylase [Clostridium oryzae]
MDLGILTLILVYVVFPNLRYRLFSSKVIKKFHPESNTVVLTFDDGPDPRYTPELLDVLKKNNVKCTFFVLASQAQKYPYLIKRIVSEGHCIGLHSLKHTNAIFTSPMKTKKDLEKSIKILGELGVDVKVFRPPWGMFNPVTCHYAKIHNFKIILWSLHAMDWSRWVNSDYIKHKIIKKVKPGDIILLHDGRGANHAPKRTISALKTILPILKKEGFNFAMAKDL